jgi:hypothetical protein
VIGAEAEAIACAPSDLPQCIQKAALALTLPPQVGQAIIAGSAGGACTGVPHSGQNFFPVTLKPHCVQVAIDSSFSIKLAMLPISREIYFL